MSQAGGEDDDMCDLGDGATLHEPATESMK